MMDSKQTPQQRIEQDGKVYGFTGETRLPKKGELFWNETFSCISTCVSHEWSNGGRAIYREAPADLAQASEEARPTAEQVVNGEEVVKASDSRKLTESMVKIATTYMLSETELQARFEAILLRNLASRDDELRRLREENERLRVRIKELERMVLDAKSFWVTEDEFKSVAAAVGLSNAPPSHVFAAVPQIIATLERHYSEARGLVEKPVPMTNQMDGVSFLESLYDGVRYNCNWHNAHYERITKTFARHDQERAACKPCGGPLTDSEADKVCAGEPVRQGEDLAAQVEKLQAENKLLREQQLLAYNWLPRRDKEMFDQKYPKEVTV